VSGDELHLSDCASGMSLLYPSNGHGIGNHIERLVHVLFKEALEFVTNEESLRGVVSFDALPDHLHLAVGALFLVLWGIQVFDFAEVRASLIALLTVVLELFGFSSADCDG